MMRLQKRYTADIVGIVLVLAILVLVIAGTLALFTTPERARGSIQNEGAQGVSRFAAWLAAQGYAIRALNTPESIPLGGDSVLFILAPRSSFERMPLLWLDAWVQSGGTLIIAQEGKQPAELLRPFGATIGRLWWPARRSSLQLPTLNWPPVGQAAIGATHYVKLPCGRAAVHLGSCERPLMVAFGRGRGQVFVLSSATPFTNEGLEDVGNAQLVENLVLATAAPGQTILFDEVHHRVPLTWLFTTPTGWALWLSVLALLAFFMWHNSYLPASHALAGWQKGRGEVETAVAINKLAKAGQQFGRYGAITNHYWQRLKRSLARRYGLDSALPDQPFIESLKPHISEAEISTIVYLASQKERAAMMTAAELRQWVSAVTHLTERQLLTREVYEYQKTV
jgi:hypothetical protein